MKYIRRDLEKILSELSKEYACILVTGPRQVGKTTLFEHIDDKRNYVSLDDLEDRNFARSDPKMFLKSYKAPILIDEVQYAPELFIYIKIAIDNGAKPGSFFLTGSQSFRLMRLAGESLAGRVAILSLPSLSQNELYGENELTPFDVDFEKLMVRAEKKEPGDVAEIYKRIWNGGMPALISGVYKSRDVYYSSYLLSYLARDFKDEITIRDDVQFVDFIRTLACRVGQELNVHSIASTIGISDNTAKRWLAMLEKSEIIYYLRPYSNNLLKRLVKSPKLYFFDTGLVAYLTKHASPEILENGPINGAILENYVVNEIRKTYMNSAKEMFLYYYRDRDQQEIDLILEANGKLHPIEIKKTSNPTSKMIRHFDLIKKPTIPIGQGAIICMNDKLSTLDKNTLIIPVWYI